MYYLNKKQEKSSMKTILTYTEKTTMWPVIMPTTGVVCIIAGADYSRGDSKGVLGKNVS